MKRINRWICIVLACLLIFEGFSITAYAAKDVEVDSEKGRILKLEKTDGDIAVENSSGRELKVREGRRLYNGYKVSTEEGYAWISLDSDKLLKLDWYSSVYIKKDRRKLEVLLESGSLFFSVNKPLEDDESLDIKTSGMSTGVRGTIGVLSTRRTMEAEAVTEEAVMHLYEGKVEVSHYESEAGVVVRDVEPGSSAMVTTQFSEQAGNEQPENEQTQSGQPENVQPQILQVPTSTVEVTGSSLKEALLSSGFAAMEVKENEVVQQRLLEADNDVDETALTEIVEKAETILVAEQETTKAKVEAIREEIQKKTEEAVNVLANSSAADSSAGKTETSGQKTSDGEPKVDQVFAKKPVEEKVEPAPAEKKELDTGMIPAAEEKEVPPLIIIDMTEEAKKEETKPESGSSGSGNGNTSTPAVPSEFTVTFKDEQGNLFAVMTVKNAGKATEPNLMPSPSGAWYKEGEAQKYDFTKSVTSDITLKWKNDN